MKLRLLLGSTLFIAPALGAQSSQDYIALPEAEEIALARSAAPAEVSAEADVWVLDEGEWRHAVKGSNGNACMVARGWPDSLEPICFDAEGARTMRVIDMRRTTLRLEGVPNEEIDAHIQMEIDGGRLSVPERPSLAYMLSSGQRLKNVAEQAPTAWQPHFMLHIPYLTAADMGLPGPLGPVQVAYEGTPWASLVTVAPSFVDPEPVEGR